MATATEERTALLERWVYLNAFELLLNAIVQMGPEEDVRVNALWPSALITDGLNVDLGSDALAGELWPLEEDYEHSLNARTAFARSESVAAACFATLATDESRNACAEAAGNLAAGVATALAKGEEA